MQEDMLISMHLLNAPNNLQLNLLESGGHHISPWPWRRRPAKHTIGTSLFSGTKCTSQMSMYLSWCKYYEVLK